ncbi:MAG: hypothetical protein H6722_10110 [Sandaracinus sp.]|nr:hypothetical protein [Sandaracinus sp.]
MEWVGAVHPRLITENACVAITRRTSFRKGFLFPWAGSGDAVERGAAAAWSRSDATTARWDAVGQLFAYSAGLAQRATGLDWHQLVLVGTHHHSQATPRDRELAESTRVLHRTMACAINAQLRMRGFDAPGSVWDKRQTHWTTLVDVEAVGSRLLYDHLNCVRAGWVEHPLDVPMGHHLGFELWKAGGVAVPKPDNPYFSKRMPKEIELRLTPPIPLVRKFGRDVDAMVAWLSELREVRRKVLMAARVGLVRGVAKMRRVHPWDEPDTDKETIGRRVKIFGVGQGGPEGEQTRRACERDVRGHREGHAARVVAWKDGDHTSPFPAGTLLGHTFLGMPLAPASSDAVLGTRHPSREEVEAELAAEWAARKREEEEHRARRRVRAERRARAARIAEDDAFERELEALQQRVRVMDPNRKASGMGALLEPLAPSNVTRRELGDARPDVGEKGRAIVLRTRERPKPRRRRRRRRNNDPPE